MFSAIGTTTTGQVTFYPTVTGASGGTPIFGTILNIQAIPVLASNNGSLTVFASVFSASTLSVTINAIVGYSGAAAANGTRVYFSMIGL